VADILCAVKAADIPPLIQAFSPDQFSLLLKFIYRAMASPQSFNCGALLAWHEKIVELAGVGAVVRVLSDRRCL
jgi:actin related protein 2/3 complex subunit 5